MNVIVTYAVLGANIWNYSNIGVLDRWCFNRHGKRKNAHKMLAETANVERKHGYGSIILKMICNKWSGVVYILTIWLRIILVQR